METGGGRFPSQITARVLLLALGSVKSTKPPLISSARAKRLGERSDLQHQLLKSLEDGEYVNGPPILKPTIPIKSPNNSFIAGKMLKESSRSGKQVEPCTGAVFVENFVSLPVLNSKLVGPAELPIENPRNFLTPQRVTSKSVIISPGSATPHFTSFLSELPPSNVCRQPVDLQAKGVLMKALSSVQKEDAASFGRTAGVLNHSTSSHHEDQGTSHSNSPIRTRPADREPTPSTEGVGAP